VKWGKCEKCGWRGWVESHHLLSQSKLNRKLYGDLLDNPKNIQNLCPDCHKNKPIDKLTEIAFCEIMKIIPRSRTGLIIWKRMELENKCKGLIDIIKNA
jgi:5-methylcytosine-specific restriction endonuclease McrA